MKPLRRFTRIFNSETLEFLAAAACASTLTMLLALGAMCAR